MTLNGSAAYTLVLRSANTRMRAGFSDQRSVLVSRSSLMYVYSLHMHSLTGLSCNSMTTMRGIHQRLTVIVQLALMCVSAAVSDATVMEHSLQRPDSTTNNLNLLYPGNVFCSPSFEDNR